MLYLNPMDDLMNVTRRSVEVYRRAGSGVLVIDCKRCSQMGGEPVFQILLYGRPRQFYVSSSQLKSYMAQKAARPAIIQPDCFTAVEETMLQVLEEGGFGSIRLEFRPEKRGGVVLILEQRLSKRYRL
jgi:hypothetical protein